ncbi:hypothetical protein [Kamptonema formosum]|uniref:hypothetical protein n=1 Tax=Kamptonema formosum TaxID=331992 RepID=UPI00034AA560|nr:hypothetical protein [Oscillatoria sp. PCC 10802]
MRRTGCSRAGRNVNPTFFEPLLYCADFWKNYHLTYLCHNRHISLCRALTGTGACVSTTTGTYPCAVPSPAQVLLYHNRQSLCRHPTVTGVHSLALPA